MTAPASISSIAAAVTAAQPRCGSTRVVAIDGPAGSGKTTLANLVAAELGGAASPGAGTYAPGHAVPTDVRILHTDDMYEGWGGLDTLEDLLVGQVLEPLAHDRAGAFRMWDWERDERGPTIPVPAPSILLVEGVGSASRAARRYASTVVWVEAPEPLRLERGIERDGEQARQQWEQWQPVQAAHHEREGTRAAADFHVDGARPLGERPPGTMASS